MGEVSLVWGGGAVVNKGGYGGGSLSNGQQSR